MSEEQSPEHIAVSTGSKTDRLRNEGKQAIDSEGFKVGIKKAIPQLSRHIEKLREENHGKELVFVVGGKSRRIGELFLDVSTGETHKLKLNEKENAELYGKGELGEAYVVPEKIKQLDKDKTVIVFIEDYLITGKKAYRTLDAMEKEGFKSEYIVLSESGPENPLHANIDRWRPRNWRDHTNQIFIPSISQREFHQGIKSAAKLRSRYARRRLASITDTTLPKELANLRSSNQLVGKIKEYLSEA